MGIGIDIKLIPYGAFVSITTRSVHLTSFGHLGSKTIRTKKLYHCGCSGNYTSESSVDRWVSELKRRWI